MRYALASASVPQWIEAIATVFAAAGTVAAVWFALWQVRRQEVRRLEVSARWAAIADGTGLHVLAVGIVNVGFRPVKLTMAYLMTDDGRQIISPFTDHSTALPVILQDGESADLFWTQSNLDQVKSKEGFQSYQYVFVTDTQGSVYKAPFPGLRLKRKGLRRRESYVRVSKGE